VAETSQNTLVVQATSKTPSVVVVVAFNVGTIVCLPNSLTDAENRRLVVPETPVREFRPVGIWSQQQ